MAILPGPNVMVIALLMPLCNSVRFGQESGLSDTA